ncbi:uncharacterized protein LOC108675969 [Hyalella azteca]|uniref:Uncharacterized protein LOC108675969 n=1 Tax=Hyalella azteca TaxID=294128 RepID=A0A8B7P0N3_HYAAZ|nr:uncharacterized protein LOC108675969 [Hyalella azteca]
MPCGCFGGASKKKGKKGLDGPPKPPKLGLEEPVKEQQVTKQEQTPVYSSQQDSRPTTINEKLTGNGTVEKTPVPPAVTTPQSDSVLVVDGGSTRSTGARCRAELYAKRREFFRPLYEVSLNSTSNRYATPRTSNTLPARGKRGGYIMGDGTGGYFTAEGKYIGPEDAGENRDPVSLDGVSGITLEGQYVDAEGRVVDRPARPMSQPSAEQWREIADQSDGLPQEEFILKRQEIIQHQQPSVPIPPPAPKPVNPHFIEFQEKHHKILFDPEHQPQHRNTDPELAQKLVEERLTELDKLHNEVKDHYEKKMKNGPVDVDSLVEKYTEERWKKMVELWESEGLVVEGGIVVVDDKGNVVEREIKSNGEGGHVVEKVTRSVEKIGPDGERVVETVESDGHRTVRVVESSRAVTLSERPGTVTTTEEILVERLTTGYDDDALGPVTTIVTPPTPQIDISSRTSPFAEIAAELNDPDEEISVETGAPADVEDGDHVELNHEDSPLAPQTCTPPPSPEQDHRSTPSVEEPSGLTAVCGAVSTDEELVIAKGSATPPPSPPLQSVGPQS